MEKRYGSMMIDRRQLLTVTQGIAERIGEDLNAPDDDWAMTLVFGSKAGISGFGMLSFNNEQEKEEVRQQLPGFLIEQQATMAGLVMSSWMAPVDESGVRPSESPERQEVLIIAAIDLQGAEFWIADIARHDDRGPELVDWRPFADSEAGHPAEIESPWVSAVRAGLGAD